MSGAAEMEILKWKKKKFWICERIDKKEKIADFT